MIGSYYFWKWADNDLSGKPTEVYATLMRGEMHPALQPFNASPLLRRLEKFAVKGRRDGEEWDWQVHPDSSPKHARFVFLSGPDISGRKKMRDRLCMELSASGVTAYDDVRGAIVDSFLPKLNCVLFGQWRDEPLYDITEDDLPVLLRRLDPNERNPYAILTNRRNCFVQCLAKQRRFVVEWRENYDLGDLAKFDQWKAQDRKRLDALDAPYTSDGIPFDKDPDFVTYADTLKIFLAFFHGKPRPARYHWRNINKEI